MCECQYDVKQTWNLKSASFDSTDYLRSVLIWRCQVRLLQSRWRPLRPSPGAGTRLRSSHWGWGRRSLRLRQPPASGRPGGGDRGQRPGEWVARPGCWGGRRSGTPASRYIAQTGGLLAPTHVRINVKSNFLQAFPIGSLDTIGTRVKIGLDAWFGLGICTQTWQ